MPKENHGVFAAPSRGGGGFFLSPFFPLEENIVYLAVKKTTYMKKHLAICLLCVLAGLPGMAQSRKSVSILGDSYSTFEGYLQPDTNAVWYHSVPKPGTTDVASVRDTWWHRLIREKGYRLCVNNSYSGATVCHRGYRNEDYSDRSFLTRLTRLGTPDIIFVFGATNDSWANVPVGEYKYAGWTPDELYTFRPAMACLLEGLIDHYPNVAVYFILNDGLSDDITESVRTICAHYGIGCIALQGIEKMSGHPSVKGMAQISEQVQAFLAAHEE